MNIESVFAKISNEDSSTSDSGKSHHHQAKQFGRSKPYKIGDQYQINPKDLPLLSDKDYKKYLQIDNSTTIFQNTLSSEESNQYFTEFTQIANTSDEHAATLLRCLHYDTRRALIFAKYQTFLNNFIDEASKSY
jgi:hypothetical protein